MAFVARGNPSQQQPHRQRLRSQSRHSFDVQPLEARTLLASVTPIVSTVATAMGNLLHVRGTSGDDRITITNTSQGLRISNTTGWATLYTGRIAQIRMDGGAGNDRLEVASNIKTDAILYGGPGIDTLVGGSGDDRLYGGDGRDYLYGMAGDDVLVSLGDASVDRLYGGAGFDSFWTDHGSDELIVDASSAELAGGAVHRITGFMPANITATGTTHSIPRTIGSTAPNLPDPTINDTGSSYQNFARYPLFSKYGPRADDIYQGAIGDCYLLASLGSIANANPQVVRDRVVDLGDGTYAVQFTSGSATVYVRVDADLPTSSWGLTYAKLGRQGSLWVAIVEKAYAFFRSNQGSYASLDSGFMGDVYDHLNLPNTSLISATSATTLLRRLQSDLAAGMAVTFGTRPDAASGAPVAGAHAYMVDSVIADASGNITHLRLRNPWGIDDTPGHGPDDGYILLTAAQALRAFWFACSAVVR